MFKSFDSVKTSFKRLKNNGDPTLTEPKQFLKQGTVEQFKWDTADYMVKTHSHLFIEQVIKTPLELLQAALTLRAVDLSPHQFSFLLIITEEVLKNITVKTLTEAQQGTDLSTCQDINDVLKQYTNTAELVKFSGAPTHFILSSHVKLKNDNRVELYRGEIMHDEYPIIITSSDASTAVFTISDKGLKLPENNLYKELNLITRYKFGYGVALHFANEGLSRTAPPTDKPIFAVDIIANISTAFMRIMTVLKAYRKNISLVYFVNANQHHEEALAILKFYAKKYNREIDYLTGRNVFIMGDSIKNKVIHINKYTVGILDKSDSPSKDTWTIFGKKVTYKNLKVFKVKGLFGGEDENVSSVFEYEQDFLHAKAVSAISKFYPPNASTSEQQQYLPYTVFMSESASNPRQLYKEIAAMPSNTLIFFDTTSSSNKNQFTQPILKEIYNLNEEHKKDDFKFFKTGDWVVVHNIAKLKEETDCWTIEKCLTILAGSPKPSQEIFNNLQIHLMPKGEVKHFQIPGNTIFLSGGLFNNSLTQKLAPRYWFIRQKKLPNLASLPEANASVIVSQEKELNSIFETIENYPEITHVFLLKNDVGFGEITQNMLTFFEKNVLKGGKITGIKISNNRFIILASPDKLCEFSKITISNGQLLDFQGQKIYFVPEIQKARPLNGANYGIGWPTKASLDRSIKVLGGLPYYAISKEDSLIRPFSSNSLIIFKPDFKKSINWKVNIYKQWLDWKEFKGVSFVEIENEKFIVNIIQHSAKEIVELNREMVLVFLLKGISLSSRKEIVDHVEEVLKDKKYTKLQLEKVIGKFNNYDCLILCNFQRQINVNEDGCSFTLYNHSFLFTPHSLKSDRITLDNYSYVTTFLRQTYCNLNRVTKGEYLEESLMEAPGNSYCVCDESKNNSAKSTENLFQPPAATYSIYYKDCSISELARLRKIFNNYKVPDTFDEKTSIFVILRPNPKFKNILFNENKLDNKNNELRLKHKFISESQSDCYSFNVNDLGNNVIKCGRSTLALSGEKTADMHLDLTNENLHLNFKETTLCRLQHISYIDNIAVYHFADFNDPNGWYLSEGNSRKQNLWLLLDRQSDLGLLKSIELSYRRFTHHFLSIILYSPYGWPDAEKVLSQEHKRREFDDTRASHYRWDKYGNNLIAFAGKYAQFTGDDKEFMWQGIKVTLDTNMDFSDIKYDFIDSLKDPEIRVSLGNTTHPAVLSQGYYWKNYYLMALSSHAQRLAKVDLKNTLVNFVDLVPFFMRNRLTTLTTLQLTQEENKVLTEAIYESEQTQNFQTTIKKLLSSNIYTPRFLIVSLTKTVFQAFYMESFLKYLNLGGAVVLIIPEQSIDVKSIPELFDYTDQFKRPGTEVTQSRVFLPVFHAIIGTIYMKSKKSYLLVLGSKKMQCNVLTRKGTGKEQYQLSFVINKTPVVIIIKDSSDPLVSIENDPLIKEVNLVHEKPTYYNADNHQLLSLSSKMHKITNRRLKFPPSARGLILPEISFQNSVQHAPWIMVAQNEQAVIRGVLAFAAESCLMVICLQEISTKDAFHDVIKKQLNGLDVHLYLKKEIRDNLVCTKETDCITIEHTKLPEAIHLVTKEPSEDLKNKLCVNILALELYRIELSIKESNCLYFVPLTKN